MNAMHGPPKKNSKNFSPNNHINWNYHKWMITTNDRWKIYILRIKFSKNAAKKRVSINHSVFEF